MSYYIRALPRCERCSKAATHEILNERNSLMGRFCKADADRHLKVLESPERSASQDQI